MGAHDHLHVSLVAETTFYIFAGDAAKANREVARQPLKSHIQIADTMLQLGHAELVGVAFAMYGAGDHV